MGVLNLSASFSLLRRASHTQRTNAADLNKAVLRSFKSANTDHLSPLEKKDSY